MWRRRSASEVGFRLRRRTEAEFVLVVGGDQVVFQLGFTIGDLRYEVVVLGLALLVFGPVVVAEMSGAVQNIPWGCGWIGARGRRGQRWRPPGLGSGGAGGPS